MNQKLVAYEFYNNLAGCNSEGNNLETVKGECQKMLTTINCFAYDFIFQKSRQLQ